MEKVIFVSGSDLKEVNQHLEDGWTVKLIAATSSGSSGGGLIGGTSGYTETNAYIVLEK